MANTYESLVRRGVYDSGTNFGRRPIFARVQESAPKSETIGPVLRAKALTPAQIRDKAQRIALVTMVDQMLD